MQLSRSRPSTAHGGRASLSRTWETPARRRVATCAVAQQAVVIGSGMSGLSAAHVLSQHFDNVIVLEKDQPKPSWGSDAVDMMKVKGSRRGVTQYNHLHAMLAGGLQALDDIFDGRYRTELQAGGALFASVFTETRLCLPEQGVWRNHTPKQDITGAYCTRHLFESTARKLVSQNPKVTVQYGAKVAGLAMQDSSSSGSSRPTVTGVRMSDGSTLPASLVVDCCGRNGPTPQWLQAAGFGDVRTSHVTAHCGYASFIARLSPESEQRLEAAGIKSIYCRAEAPEKTMGILVRVENGMWLVGLGGYDKMYPPMKDDELQEYADNVVWHPEVGELLKGCKMLAPAGRFYDIGNTWHHFEDVDLPEHLVIMADSICSFNPVHGQGMTVAALEVKQLDKLLTQRSSSSGSSNGGGLNLQGLSNEWQQVALPIVKAAWDQATGVDLKFHGAITTGDVEVAGSTDPPGILARFKAGYNAALYELAAYDPVVNEALTRVMHVLESPDRLMAPDVLQRVIMLQLKKAFSGNSATSSSSSSNNKIMPAESGNGSSNGNNSTARAKAAADISRYELFA